MSESEDLLAGQASLLEATLALLHLAREESWDRLLEAMPAQRAAFARLQASGVGGLDASTQDSLKRLIEQTEAANEELVTRLLAWQNEVSTILQEIDMTRANGKKISRAYGA
ncbi:hypothetical protein [Chitinimonas sp.]|uniref:hypothetical protein n=1 Tax=Chitinimonas sp. TaxID=1934313 RepID=UPI002F9552CC